MGKSATAAPPRLSGGREKLVRAFETHRDELVSTLFFMLGNHADAQDAAQEAFVKCWRRRHQLHRVHNIRAWLFRVGLNAAKDLQRNAWRRRNRPLEAVAATVAASQPAPIESLLAHERTARLRQALLDLRGEEKQVFLLRQNAALTYEEIAAVTKRPVGTVKTQMRTALMKLRAVLHDEGNDE